MICSQIINLNICFDVADFIDDKATCEVSTFVGYPPSRGWGLWPSLTKCDFYTNHEYIPKAHISGYNEDFSRPQVSRRIPSLPQTSPGSPWVGTNPSNWVTPGTSLPASPSWSLADKYNDPDRLKDNVLDFKQDYRTSDL